MSEREGERGREEERERGREGKRVGGREGESRHPVREAEMKYKL